MYWTLDTRPPTLDERIIQAKAQHAERVEQIAAEEPVPQLEVPEAPGQVFHIGPTLTVRPGRYFEVSEADMRAYHERQQRIHLQRLAAQQNMGMNGLRYGEGLVPQSNPWAAAHGAPGGLSNLGGYPFPTLSEAQHTFQVTKDGTRWLSSRGPFYQPPRSFGTLTEFV